MKLEMSELTGLDNLTLASFKEEDRLLNTLFVNAPAGMYLAQKGRFVMVNLRLQKNTGYSQQDFQGTPTIDFVLTEDQSRVKKNAVKMLKGESSLPYDFRIKIKNGEVRWVIETVSSILYQGRMAVLGHIMDITEHKSVEQQLKYLSFHDNLTGLYNRSFFEEEVKRLDTSRQLPLSIIVGDVNGLKMINDLFGNSKGDMVIVNVAGILKKACRKEDILCRWGGDEFALLLPKVNERLAEQISVRIQNACKVADEKTFPLSLSLGVATKEREDQDIWMVIKEAEDRLNRRKYLESRSSRSSVLEFIHKALGEKGNETEEHLLRLNNYSFIMGDMLSLSFSERDRLALLSLLHDLGKIAIPVHILNKPGRLNHDEWEIMKTHSEIGSRVARSIPELSQIEDEILFHHEHWDGNGYPRGLKGEQIPLLSRIIAVCDAFEVMINGRCYKEPMSIREAEKELTRCAGTQFDPDITKVFLKGIRRGRSKGPGGNSDKK